MKSFTSVMSVAGLGLCLAGCAIAMQAQQAQKIKEATEKSEAAINECKDKRLRKELKTYKESAECSNPRVYAAWQEAGDPYLDLTGLLLAAKLVCAENMDKGKATEAECRLQVAELNSRLVSERQRRDQAVAQTRTQAQAANAQSTAALLQGLAALDAANRSNTINCTTTGPYAVRSTSCY
jgi:hypothetical protein